MQTHRPNLICALPMFVSLAYSIPSAAKDTVTNPDPCAAVIAAAGAAIASGQESADAYAYDTEVPQNLRHSQYPVSFSRQDVVRGDGCMRIQVTPIFRGTGKTQNITIDPSEKGFPVYLALLGKMPPRGKIPSIQGYRISETPLDLSTLARVRGYISDITIIAATEVEGRRVTLGANVQNKTQPPSKTAPYRYWFTPPGSSRSAVVLCAEDCRQQLAVDDQPTAAEAQTVVFEDSSAKGRVLPPEQSQLIDVEIQCSPFEPITDTRTWSWKEYQSVFLQKCIGIQSSAYSVAGEIRLAEDGRGYIIPVSRNSISLQHIRVHLVMAGSNARIPNGCEPLLEYSPPDSAQPVTLPLKEAGEGDGERAYIVDQNKIKPKLDALDPLGTLRLLFRDGGSCALDPAQANARRIIDLEMQEQNLALKLAVFLNQPSLHVVFMFNDSTTGRVLRQRDARDLIVKSLEGLKEIVEKRPYQSLSLYSGFTLDPIATPEAITSFRASGFPSFRGVEVGPLAESLLADYTEGTTDFTVLKAKNFVNAVMRDAEQLPNLDKRAVFFFIGRHVEGEDYVCKKGPFSQLMELEDVLGSHSARAVLIGFYGGGDTIVDKRSPDTPRLEPMPTETFGEFPFRACIAKTDAKHAGATTDQGNESAPYLLQVPVDWRNRSSSVWREDFKTGLPIVEGTLWR